MLNKRLAFQSVAKKLKEVTVGEVLEGGTYFGHDFDEAFEWIFVEEATEDEDMRDLIKNVSNVTVKQMNKIGATTPKEFMVLSHHNVFHTSYGIVYFPHDE